MSEQTPGFDELMKPKNSYYLIDGKSRAYDCREEIKSWGGFWNPRAKFWQINDPSEEARNVFKQSGLILQFKGKYE